MEPTLHEEDVVLISSLPYLFKNPKVEDVIVLKRQKYIIKRITKEDRGKFFVEGDNKKESTDSRDFGWVFKKEIFGKVIYHFSSLKS